jgi:hypothetical protein
MSIIQHEGGTTFTGESVGIFQAIAIKGALKLYANTGIKVNRAYTPKNMMLMVTKITGKKLGARDYLGGVEALEQWIQAQARG